MVPSPRADFLLIAPSGIPVAVVEAKNSRSLTPEVASQLRDSLLPESGGQWVPFFLLLSEEYGHLWLGMAPAGALPNFSFPVRDSMRAVLGTLHVEGRLRAEEFEILVWEWIDRLVREEPGALLDPEARQALDRSGFLASIRGARVARAAA